MATPTQNPDPSPIQKLLDKFFYKRKQFVDTLTYWNLRIYGLEPKFTEVEARKYSDPTFVPLVFDASSDLETLVEIASKRFDQAVSRRETVASKAATILTLTSILVGILAVVLPKQLSFPIIWQRILAGIAVGLLLNTLVLVLVILDVGTAMSPKVDQNEVSLSANELRASLTNSYLQCAIYTDASTSFLVDVFKATRFCFLSALFLASVLVVSSLASSGYNSETFSADLRSDSNLVNLLRGPKGDRGEPGPKGPEGRFPGLSGTDYDHLLNRLLSEPKLIRLLEDSTGRRPSRKSRAKNASRPIGRP
jgi:hypothetical protein